MEPDERDTDGDDGGDWSDGLIGASIGILIGALLAGLLSGCGAVRGAAMALQEEPEPRAWQEPVQQRGAWVQDSAGQIGYRAGNQVYTADEQWYRTIVDGFGQRWIVDDNGNRARIR